MPIPQGLLQHLDSMDIAFVSITDWLAAQEQTDQVVFLTQYFEKLPQSIRNELDRRLR